MKKINRMFVKKYRDRLTKKKVLAKYKDFCEEIDAMFKTAEEGKTVFQMRIDTVMGVCERYLQTLKEYSIVRRRKIRRDSKSELADSNRKTGEQEKLSYSNDVVTIF